jgi:hypothetical protein
MAITSLDTLIAASKVIRPAHKTAARTTVAGGWFSIFDIAGANPGVLAGGKTSPASTATGEVVTDAIPGYPNIPFSANRSYLSRLGIGNTVGCSVRVFDRIWMAGAYAFNANIAVSSPSWASRVSYNGGSADYNGLEIWVENVTAATGNLAVNVTYTDQDGNTGATTGAVGIAAAPSVGRCWQLPFAAGDNGVQAISNVQGTVATAGTFNVMVLRPLVNIYVPAGAPVILNWSDLGLPEVFNDSALYTLSMAPSGTSLGTIAPYDFQFSNG